MKYLNFLIFFFVTTQIVLTQNIHDLAYPTCDSISFNRFKDYSPNDLLGKQDFDLGICSLLNSQFKQALEYFNLAKEKGVKDEVSIDYYLARCYAGLKNFEESNFYLNKALSNGLDYEIFFMTPEWDVYRYKYYKDIVLKYGIKISKWDLVFLIISLLSLILSLHFFFL